MPSNWQLSLNGPSDPAIPLEAPHAVVSRWLDVDHKASPKAYALSPPGFRPGGVTLTVRLLDDSLAGPLAASTVPGEEVRLGAHWFTIGKAPELLGGTAWASLGSRGPRAWEIEFLSPTAFRRGSRTSPWPAPTSIITSLIERWRGIDPATGSTRDARELAASVWVSDLDGHSEVIQLRGTTVSGFIGRIRYVCDGSEDDAATIHALMAFAEFAGIGSHTAFGLGTVQITASRGSGTPAPVRTAPAGTAAGDPLGSRP